MKTYYVEAFDIPDSWYQLLNLIIENGREYQVDRGSFEKDYRKELDYVTVHIKNPAFRPFYPIIPPGLNIEPPTSLEYIENYFQNYILSPIKQEEELYTYGERLNYSLFKVIDILKNTPNTNQAILQIGTLEDIDLDDPACLRHVDCRIIDNKLHFIVYFRSNDLWSGYPSNLPALQLLKEFMCEQIGCEDGEIIYSSKGLHLYRHAWEFAKQRIYKKE